jgi:hypothetical protein
MEHMRINIPRGKPESDDRNILLVGLGFVYKRQTNLCVNGDSKERAVVTNPRIREW